VTDSVARIGAPADSGFTLVGRVDSSTLRTEGNARTVTVPAGDPIAVWLADASSRPVPLLTVDSDEGRWSGLLHHFVVRRPREGEAAGELVGEWRWVMESRWVDGSTFDLPELPA